MTLHTGHVTDFDFLTGSWQVASRRRRERWTGSDDWDEFDGVAHCDRYLGGVANVDEVDFSVRGFKGMTVRVFDLVAEQWSISWVNSTVGRLEPPVIGGFSGDVGSFEGTDVDGGIPVTVRFTWTVIDAGAARWEQAFCRDGDAWETNWIMDFRRTDPT
jgi:hypothetical protein